MKILLPDMKETKTQADGVYHLIVPLRLVYGETAVIEATDKKLGTGRAEVVLKGGQMIQDIQLTAGARPTQPARPNTPATTAAVTGSSPSTSPGSIDSLSAVANKGYVDGDALTDLAGPMDLVSALAGRVTGMMVTSASASGTSALAVIRGAHSISGPLSPLFVIDGVPMDNSEFASTVGEQFGLGGFDMGSSLGDLSLQDIASVRTLSAADAAPLYGSRAANGVVLVTTKNGFGTDGFEVFAHRQSTSDKPLRLPQYQNQYGQGLGGQFEFLDGKGGGINDGVAQSWGPALDGRAVAQASYTVPGRAAVRLWTPDAAAGVANYFSSGNNVLMSGGVQGASDLGSFRVSVNSDNASGLTAQNTVHRLGGSFSGTARPLPKLLVSASIQGVGTTANDRPGTGFDDINPVSAFVILPRQVNLDSLRVHLRDSTNQQINWIYTGINNPTFQTSQNTNRDVSALVVGGALVQYQLAPWLSGAIQSGINHYHADRAVKVAAGWLGGYPTALGRGDFSGGGAQAQTISANQFVTDVSLSANSPASHWMHGVYSVGFENRSSSSNDLSTVVDVSTNNGGTPTGGGTSGTVSSSGTVVALYGTAGLAFGKNLSMSAGAREETSSSLPSGHNSNLYPSLSGSYDLVNGLSGFKKASHLRAATLRASWWQSGNEITPRTLAGTYAGQGTALAPVVGVQADSRLRNELTTGAEIGTTLMMSRNIGLDLSVYHERSSDLLIPELGTSTATGEPSAAPTGVVSNRGIEAQLHTVLLRDYNGFSWDATTSFAKNVNRVDAVDGATTEVPLGPALWGASIVARQGSPVGSIEGRRFLRDAATGELILKNGLPLPDMSGGPAVLGSWQPSGTGSITSTMRYNGIELAILVDARFGGKIFSATNYWGSYSGTLESTVDRPVGGRVIAGIDSVTGKANGTAVTTEDYYHALGPITEAWVYDASFAKLRELRIDYTYSLARVPYLTNQSVNVALVTRNLWMWAKVPNIDPETTLGTGAFQGVEMGQLPNARSVGLRFSIIP